MKANKKSVAAFILTATLIFSLYAPLGVSLPQPAAAVDVSIHTGDTSNVHLVAPVSVAACNDGFIVADLINGGTQTAFHIYGTSAESSQSYRRGTFIIDGAVRKIQLSGTMLFYIIGNDVFECNINFVTTEVVGLINGTHTYLDGLVDYFVSASYAYILRDESLQILTRATSLLETINRQFSGATSMTEANNARYVHWQNKYTVYAIGTSDVNTFDLNFTAKSIISIPGAPAAFISGSSIKAPDGSNLITTADNSEIISAAANSDSVYVLTKSGKLHRYMRQGGASGPFARMDFEVGKTAVSMNIPSVILDFALVTPTGYPANILYAAAGETHSAECTTLTSDQSLLVLLYPNWHLQKYYLVLFEGKYGFIERSADTLEDDLFNINTGTELSDVSVLKETASTAHIYSLPYYDSTGTFHRDSIVQGTKVTLLRRIYGLTAANNDWYYVEYFQGETPLYGFVNALLIRDIAEVDVKETLGIYKINPKITQTVKLFTDEMLERPTRGGIGDREITIAAGTNVIVLSQDAYGVSLIQVHIDDVLYTGYLESAFLLKPNKLTDYAAIGIILLLLAVGLTVFFIIAKRRKKFFFGEKSLKQPDEMTEE